MDLSIIFKVLLLVVNYNLLIQISSSHEHQH